MNCAYCGGFIGFRVTLTMTAPILKRDKYSPSVELSTAVITSLYLPGPNQSPTLTMLRSLKKKDKFSPPIASTR